jgi:hypothetical protein
MQSAINRAAALRPLKMAHPTRKSPPDFERDVWNASPYRIFAVISLGDRCIVRGLWRGPPPLVRRPGLAGKGHTIRPLASPAWAARNLEQAQSALRYALRPGGSGGDMAEISTTTNENPVAQRIFAAKFDIISRSSPLHRYKKTAGRYGCLNG